MHKSLRENVAEHVRAGFSGIWIESHEHDQAIKELEAVCASEQWKLLTYDVAKGVNGDGNGDPISALKSLKSLARQDSMAILAAPNFHRMLGNGEVLQHVYHALVEGKELGTFLIVLAPVVQIPPELEKLFVVLRHDLPTREELDAIARGIGTQEGDLPEDMDALLDAAVGLTRYEAEAAFALSLARHGKIESSTLWELKAGMLKKAGTLALHQGGERFSDLGGLEGVKSFCTRALTTKNPLAKAKGVLLLGVPGAGKSAFAKALGNETGRPTVTLDFGALMGSLVGQTEQRTRQALAIVDAMAPCVLFVDEIEKGLSGAGGSGDHDSGVSSRMLGSLLTWLNDHTSDVFFVGTCNDIAKLTKASAGAFTRAERFDAVFFIDLPGPAEKVLIWRMYREHFGLTDDGSWDTIDDAGWTGAEIKACCRTAAMLGITLAESAENVVPVSQTAGGSIAELREWADGRALDANKPGRYRRAEGIGGKATGQRRVVRAG